MKKLTSIEKYEHAQEYENNAVNKTTNDVQSSFHRKV